MSGTADKLVRVLPALALAVITCGVIAFSIDVSSRPVKAPAKPTVKNILLNHPALKPRLPIGESN